MKEGIGLSGAGGTRQEILREYGLLEPEDMAACMECAAGQLNHPDQVGA